MEAGVDGDFMFLRPPLCLFRLHWWWRVHWQFLPRDRPQTWSHRIPYPGILTHLLPKIPYRPSSQGSSQLLSRYPHRHPPQVSLNPRIVWIGSDLWRLQCQGRVTWSKWHRNVLRWVPNVSTQRRPMPSLGSPFQACSTWRSSSHPGETCV